VASYTVLGAHLRDNGSGQSRQFHNRSQAVTHRECHAMDEQEAEILTYRAFRERQTRLEWETRRRAEERIASFEAVETRGRPALLWIRNAGEWVSDQIARTF
jgi:hypothetical protein